MMAAKKNVIPSSTHQEAMLTGELKSQVDKIWETFWTGCVSNLLAVIEQFTFLLFLRRLDENQLLAEKKPIYWPRH